MSALSDALDSLPVLRGLKSLSTLVQSPQIVGSAILHQPSFGWTMYFLIPVTAVQPSTSTSRKRKRRRSGKRPASQKTEKQDFGHSVWMEYSTYTFLSDDSVTEQPVEPEEGVIDITPEQRHRYIAEAMNLVGVHQIYAPTFGNICYLKGTNVERYHVRMLQRLRHLVAASGASIDGQLAITLDPDIEGATPRPSRTLLPANNMLVIGCAMLLPKEHDSNSEWSVWWLCERSGRRPCRWLNERVPSVSERAKWQYPLLALHQLTSTILPPNNNDPPIGDLFVNLLDVGDQTVERREQLETRLRELLEELRSMDPEGFSSGDYLSKMEKLLGQGSELGEEPLT